MWATSVVKRRLPIAVHLFDLAFYDTHKHTPKISLSITEFHSLVAIIARFIDLMWFNSHHTNKTSQQNVQLNSLKRIVRFTQANMHSTQFNRTFFTTRSLHNWQRILEYVLLYGLNIRNERHNTSIRLESMICLLLIYYCAIRELNAILMPNAMICLRYCCGWYWNIKTKRLEIIVIYIWEPFKYYSELM